MEQSQENGYFFYITSLIVSYLWRIRWPGFSACSSFNRLAVWLEQWWISHYFPSTLSRREFKVKRDSPVLVVSRDCTEDWRPLLQEAHPQVRVCLYRRGLRFNPTPLNPSSAAAFFCSYEYFKRTLSGHTSPNHAGVHMVSASLAEVVIVVGFMLPWQLSD